eukprot:g15063.t1
MGNCMGNAAQALCGAEMEREVEQRVRIRRLEQEPRSARFALDEKDDKSESVTDSLIEKVDKVAQNQKEELEQKLKEIKEKYEEKLHAAEAETENGQRVIESLMRDRANSDLNTNDVDKLMKKVDAQGARIDDIMNQDDDENYDHDIFEMDRAYKEDWKSLLDVKPMSDPEWDLNKDKNKKVQDRFYSPPVRKGKTFRQWQSALFRWCVRMLRTRWTMSEIGHQIQEMCFDGFPAAAQIAEDNGPDVVKIMEEMILEESPMTDYIESEMQRLLPLVKRRDGISPMMWLTALKDIFNKEKQVLGEDCRTDKSRYNYIMDSLRLDKVHDAQIRATFRPLAKNNMINIRTQIQKLKILDTSVYSDRGVQLKNTKSEQDHMEELCGLFGASLKIKTDRTHTAEYNQYLANATGVSLFGGGMVCPPVVDVSSPSGGGIHFDLGGLGGGPAPSGTNNGETALSLNSGGKKLTPEELEEMKKTPCPYGEKCYNLINKGGCLRKHTGKEIFKCLKEFEEKRPALAAEKKKEKEERKKKAEEDRKKKAAEAAKKNS